MGWLRTRVSGGHNAVPADFGYVELRGGGSRVSLVPSLGGRIVDMELAGRQWLWRNTDLRYEVPGPGTPYAETADFGGYDECFPTIGPCELPTWVKGFGGLSLDDHGELWWIRPTVEVQTAAGGQIAIARWSGHVLPYEFERVIRVTKEGAVEIRYSVRNLGRQRMPFLWSSHPLFPLTPQTQIALPPNSRLRVAEQHDISLGDARAEHRWPAIRVLGKTTDLSVPAALGKKYECTVFADAAEGWLRLREGDLELEATFDRKEVPYVRVVISYNHRHTKTGKPHSNIGVQPSLGAPDSLTDALGSWDSAQWIEARGERSWTVTWRARQIPPPEPAP